MRRPKFPGRRPRGIVIDPNIRLYHGSSVRFGDPRADASSLPCDFGKGFYLTPDYSRAEERARYKLKGGTDEAYVLAFDYDDEAAERDSASGKRPFIITFEAGKEWLDFVERNWDTRYTGIQYLTTFDGIIIGPSSDANIERVLREYRNSPRRPEDVERALRELDLEKYGEQYFFGSDEVMRKYLKRVRKADRKVRR